MRLKILAGNVGEALLRGVLLMLEYQQGMRSISSGCFLQADGDSELERHVESGQPAGCIEADGRQVMDAELRFLHQADNLVEADIAAVPSL
ncbi:hypothetical protein [Luteibacter sp. HA06]|jgi:hypothetical protein